MVKSKVTRLDPLGVRRVMDVGGPPALKNAYISTKSNTNKAKPTGKSSTVPTEPKPTRRSSRHVGSDFSTSESSGSELTSIWGGNLTPTPEVQLTQPAPIKNNSFSPAASPSGFQNVSVVADVHCSQAGTKAVRLGACKPTSTSRTPADPPNADEITVDDDFTVIKPKKHQRLPPNLKKKTISAAALNTSLPASPTPENQISGSSQPSNEQFLTTPRQKIPPVVIQHHFQGDLTRLNKGFHTQFQPTGFTAYRIKAGIACQTSTYKDYLNLQTFLKNHKVPFNLIRHNASKPHRVVLKGIPPSTPPKTIQEELLALGYSVQNVIPMTT
jgi:hypothetical protein